MATDRSKYQSNSKITQLEELKDKVEVWHDYFKENIERYRRFVRFVFKSGLNEAEYGALAELQYPTIEFNILEAFVSRLRGDFARNQPSPKISSRGSVNPALLPPYLPQQIEVLEGHLRSIFCQDDDELKYNIYTDLLAGGFSAAEVFPDYDGSMSFEQILKLKRVYDPTMTFFDPLAEKSHKGDGCIAGKLYPMLEKEIKEKYGVDVTKKMKFSTSLGGFNWSYRTIEKQQKIGLIAEAYIKNKKRTEILQLANGEVVTRSQWNKLQKAWQENNVLAPLPAVTNVRTTVLDNIERVLFCENEILEKEQTDFDLLPIVFFDGNSQDVHEAGALGQMTRPYVYHAEGIQRLKTYAGQSLANELENMIRTKFIVATESIDEDYLEAYQTPQKASVFQYNHYLDPNVPDSTLPPPQIVQTPPIPPQIAETFRLSDEMTQGILGNFDSAQGQNTPYTSGKAFELGTMQSNVASYPYLMGFSKGLNRVAEVFLRLVPKYYKTPRTLPVILPGGKRSAVVVNQDGAPSMQYNPDHLEVCVETGASFAMQQHMALRTFIELSEAYPNFSNFINTEGLELLLDNVDIRGIDALKVKVEQYQQQQKQMQQQQMKAQQQAQQIGQQTAQAELVQKLKEAQAPTRTQIDAQKVQQDGLYQAGELAVKERQAETDFLELLNTVRTETSDAELRAAEIDAENARTAVQAAIKNDIVGQR